MHLLWVLPMAALLVILVAVFFYSVRTTVNSGERAAGRCLRDEDPDCGDYTDQR